MKYSEISHTGLVRRGNEDSFCISPHLNLVAVADGMGGHEAGEVASYMAVNIVENYLQLRLDYRQSPGEYLAAAAMEANGKIYQAAQKRKSYRGMGTTLTAGLIGEGELNLVHVGDSRVYLINEGIHLITQDHSLVQELVLNGGISEEEALTHPQKNILTRALGTSSEVKVDLIHTYLNPGDRLLFCTDGLSNQVQKEELYQVIKETSDLKEGVQKLLSLALDRGGLDNITIILVEVE